MIRVASLLALTLLLATAGASSAGTTWSNPTMFFVGGRMVASSVDDGGGVHAIIAKGGLWYANEASHRRIVRRPHRVFGAAIAVANDGDLFIAWVDGRDRSALWLTRRLSGSWVSSRVWLGAASDPSVAVKGQGVGIAFRDSAHRLRYLRWRPDGGPTAAAVVASRCCVGPPSLTMLGGRPRIAFSDRIDGHLRLASLRRSGGWRVRTIDFRRTRSPVAARSLNRVAIAYDSVGRIGCVFSDGERCQGIPGQAVLPSFSHAIATDAAGGVSISAMTVEGAAGSIYTALMVRDVVSGRMDQAVFVQRLNVADDPRPPLMNGGLGRVDGRAIAVFSSDDGFEEDGTTGHWVTREIAG